MPTHICCVPPLCQPTGAQGFPAVSPSSLVSPHVCNSLRCRVFPQQVDTVPASQWPSQHLVLIVGYEAGVLTPL